MNPLQSLSSKYLICMTYFPQFSHMWLTLCCFYECYRTQPMVVDINYWVLPFSCQQSNSWNYTNDFKNNSLFSTCHLSFYEESQRIWYTRNITGDLTIKDIRQKHDDVIRGIHGSTVNSPHKSQWRGALMFSLICACMNGWPNNREAGDLRHHCGHYDITVMNTS